MKINICNKYKYDTIEYKCCGGYGIKSIELDKYLNKMILNTYLYYNCYICGENIISDKIYLKDNNLDAFSYCFSCKKIFCNNYYCLFLHKLKCQNNSISINVNKMKYICLDHSIMLNEEFPYTWYCVNDRKNLCDRCYSEENKNHNIIYKEEKAPIQINDIKEEENILLKITEYLEEDQKNFINVEEKKLKKSLEINKELFNFELKTSIDNLNNQKKDELSKKEKELEEKISNNKKNYYNFMKDQINLLSDNLKTIANELKEENIIKNNNVNDVDIKNIFNSINNCFKSCYNLEKLKNIVFSEKEKEYNDELNSFKK